jgi:hypothetical protein
MLSARELRHLFEQFHAGPPRRLGLHAKTRAIQPNSNYCGKSSPDALSAESVHAYKQ